MVSVVVAPCRWSGSQFATIGRKGERGPQLELRNIDSRSWMGRYIIVALAAASSHLYEPLTQCSDAAVLSDDGITWTPKLT